MGQKRKENTVLKIKIKNISALLKHTVVLESSTVIINVSISFSLFNLSFSFQGVSVAYTFSCLRTNRHTHIRYPFLMSFMLSFLIFVVHFCRC